MMSPMTFVGDGSVPDRMILHITIGSRRCSDGIEGTDGAYGPCIERNIGYTLGRAFAAGGRRCGMILCLPDLAVALWTAI